MNSHRFTEAFAILAMTVLGNALVGNAAIPVPVNEAIAILKRIESQIQVTEWVAHHREVILSDPSDIESVVDVKPQYGKMHVIFSPGTGKYFAEIESVSRWVDGAAPFVSEIQADAYDGDVFRHWLRSIPGRQLPTPETVAGRGYVTREMNSATGPRDFVKDYGWRSGLGFMPPFCHDFEGRPTVLSELLAVRVRERIPVSINEDDAGIWTIRLDDPSRYRDRLQLRVDPGRNGVIVGAEWRGGREYGLWRRLEVDVREVGGGIHVPLRLKRYPGLTATAEAHKTRSWILGLGVTLVAGVLIWCMWWVGRKGVAGVLIPLLLHGMVGSAAELDPDGNWVISHAPGERIVISQCGFTVASFTLMHFDREFDAEMLSKALRPEDDGVSMRDLRAAFEAYGLSPIVRKNVSVSQLGRALTPGRIAIVPLRLRHDQNHYFIAMLDRNRKPLLVNVLFGHGPLADALSDEELLATSGIVMFVEATQAKAKATSMSELVHVSPSTIDLGQVSMTGTAPVEIASAFTVTNTGDRAVCVVDLQKSCGCTQPDCGDWTMTPFAVLSA